MTPIPSISPPLVVAGLVLFVLGVVESPLLFGMTVFVVVVDEDDVVVIVDSFLEEISEITFFQIFIQSKGKESILKCYSFLSSEH